VVFRPYFENCFCAWGVPNVLHFLVTMPKISKGIMKISIVKRNLFYFHFFGGTWV
jgi:hypothetical protein